MATYVRRIGAWVRKGVILVTDIIGGYGQTPYGQNYGDPQ